MIFAKMMVTTNVSEQNGAGMTKQKLASCYFSLQKACEYFALIFGLLRWLYRDNLKSLRDVLGVTSEFSSLMLLHNAGVSKLSIPRAA